MEPQTLITICNDLADSFVEAELVNHDETTKNLIRQAYKIAFIEGYTLQTKEVLKGLNGRLSEL